MSSIQSREIVTVMLENNGVYPGDPQMDEIWSYDGVNNSVNYKLLYSGMGSAEFLSSPYITNPVLLWGKECGLTPQGQSVIDEQRKDGR